VNLAMVDDAATRERLLLMARKLLRLTATIVSLVVVKPF
jgi:hypothetical protein